MKLIECRAHRVCLSIGFVFLLGGFSLALADEVNVAPVVKSEESSVKPWTPTWRGQAESVDKTGYSMVIGLGSCIAVLFGGLALAKKAGWVKVPTHNRSVQVLEKIALSSKSSLCVIEAEGKKYLIAVGSERVSLVSRLGKESSTIEDESFEEFLCEKQQPISAC